MLLAQHVASGKIIQGCEPSNGLKDGAVRPSVWMEQIGECRLFGFCPQAFDNVVPSCHSMWLQHLTKTDCSQCQNLLPWMRDCQISGQGILVIKISIGVQPNKILSSLQTQASLQLTIVFHC